MAVKKQVPVVAPSVNVEPVHPVDDNQIIQEFQIWVECQLTGGNPLAAYARICEPDHEPGTPPEPDIPLDPQPNGNYGNFISYPTGHSFAVHFRGDYEDPDDAAGMDQDYDVSEEIEPESP